MIKVIFTFLFLIQFNGFLFAENYEERFFSKSKLSDCYEVGFKNNCYGNYRGENGVFEGEFQNNQRNGSGLYKFDNGQIFFGGFKNDKPVVGWYLYNGNTSEFLDLLKLGFRNNYKLEQTLVLLKSFKGEWYFGQFENDKRHGFGSLLKDGVVIQAGNWSNDTLIQSTASNNPNQGDDIFQALARFGNAYNKATKQKRYLKSEWSGSSGKMCSYDDGSVDSIGFESICPQSK
jgi:hypothetical protein